MGACLFDTEAEKQTIDAGSVEFSEGDYAYERGEIYYSSGKSYRSVEVKSGENKKIKVYLRPSYYNRPYDDASELYTELVEQYKGYDSVIIYEQKSKSSSYQDHDYNYASCYNLNEDIIKESIKIKLTP